MKLYLASSSPRRKRLLKQIGLKFNTLKVLVDEGIEKQEKIEDYVRRVAKIKVLEAGNLVRGGIIIGADTVVVLNNQILGKPKNKDDAYLMLKKLSGKEHYVITGIAMLKKESTEAYHTSPVKKLSSVVRTKVRMRRLSEEEIRNYVESGEPLDCAGAYAIQGKGAILIEKIEGCYYNVVGLPLTRLWQMLRKIKEGIDDN